MFCFLTITIKATISIFPLRCERIELLLPSSRLCIDHYRKEYYARVVREDSVLSKAFDLFFELLSKEIKMCE